MLSRLRACCGDVTIGAVQGCTGLTDEVVTLCAALPRLQELDLSALAISDDGVEVCFVIPNAHTVPPCPSYACLACLGQAAAAIHALRSLSIFGCREVTSAPLSQFQHHDNIQVINARGTQVSASDGAVRALLSSRRQKGLAAVMVLTGDL